VEPLSVGACLDEGWRLFGRHRGLLIGVWLLAASIGEIPALFGWLYPNLGFVTWWGLVFSAFVIWPLYVGQMYMALLLARNQPCGFGTAFAGFARFWRLVGIGIVIWLRTVVALLPLLVSFIIWSLAGISSLAGTYALFGVGGAVSLFFVSRVGIRYMYAGVVALDEKLGVSESIGRSSEVTRGSLGRLFGICLLIGLIAVLPATLMQIWLSNDSLWVQLLVTALLTAFLVGPWMGASEMVAYRTLRGEGREAEAGSGDES
jgi:hypothetical protein